MITISYDPDDRIALISADNTVNGNSWAAVRRVCEERGLDQAEVLGPRLIKLPWWAFLGLRSDLKTTLDINHLPLTLNAQAREKLKQANNFDTGNGDFAHISTQELQARLEGSGFTRKLTAQQIRDLVFLLQLNSAADFSVPGAGKTSVALAYYFLKRNDETKLLVVAPKNAFASWEEQLKLCMPSNYTNFMPVRLVGGETNIRELLSQNPFICLISYQQLYTALAAVAPYVSDNCFMYIDESHRMKKGQQGCHGRTILSLAHLPTKKLILSGTPLPNKISDLIPQYRFLRPDRRPTEANISQYVRELYVRTTKEELNLPPVTRKLYPVLMNPAQSKLYKCLSSEAARQVSGLSVNDRIRMRAFARCIVRLMQVTTDPGLIRDSDISDQEILRQAIMEGDSPKIIEACKIARGLADNGNKSIIWTQFVNNVENIASMLEDLGAEYIHGGVETDEDEENIESREYKINKFHKDPNCMVLVANPAACSEGISLHMACHNAIYVDRNYNAAQYLQSEDRIHRLGLARDEKTTIYLLHCPGTIDESINRRLNIKVDLMRRVLNDGSLNIEPLQMFDDDIDLDEGDIRDIQRILLGE